MNKHGWYWFLLVLQILFHTPSVAAEVTTKPVIKLPGQSAQLLPVLKTEIETFWPGLAPREFIAGVIDQESNWKPTARLKTSRELGCGLGQHTIAYNADGSVRFDGIAETKRLDKSLKDWNWQDCGQVQYQLRGTVLKLKASDRNCSVLMKANRDVKACDGSQYNGGAGNTAKRIKLCRLDKECDPTLWYGHLEKQCGQSKVKVQGYGESFCEINSKYPSRVEARMLKFKGLLD